MLEMVWYQRGEQMIAAVSAVTRIPRAEIVGPSRKRHVVRARQVACWAMREVLKYSYPIIAKAVGRSDHSTAIYAHDVISYLYDKDPDVRTICDKVKKVYIVGCLKHLSPKPPAPLPAPKLSKVDLYQKQQAERHETMMRQGSRDLLRAIVQNHGYAFIEEPARACA